MLRALELGTYQRFWLRARERRHRPARDGRAAGRDRARAQRRPAQYSARKAVARHAAARVHWPHEHGLSMDVLLRGYDRFAVAPNTRRT
jgi:hypothetical protein